MKKKIMVLTMGLFLLVSFSFLIFCGNCSCAASPWGLKIKLMHNQAAATEKPVVTSHFAKENPASRNAVLRWQKVEGAVAYELEVFTAEDPQGSSSSQQYTKFYSTKRIYTNGYNVLLPENLRLGKFYWHVRALDIDSKPVGPYSDMEEAAIDPTRLEIPKPVPTSVFNETTGSVLLYPVYSWIPVQGAARYEVEILDDVPENPNGTEPSVHRIDAFSATGFDAYDQKARISHRPLYWRVRGLDSEGNPVGVFSDAGKFMVNPSDNYEVATYGDSITHGGGSISYSPADWEYSYQHYLNFQTINLGRSGDTSDAMVERFEADVLPFHPKYLIILAGTNSLRGGVSSDSVIQDLQAIKEKCIENDIEPVFLTLPPVNPKNIQRAFHQPTVPDWKKNIREVNEYIRTQNHIDIERDLDSVGGVLPTDLALDGLHLDIPGKKLMAQAINEQWNSIAV